MRIPGDADLARRLQRLAERFDPDWQQPFFAVFGAVVGVQVAHGFAGALKQARTLGGEFACRAAEYVVVDARAAFGRTETPPSPYDEHAPRDTFSRPAPPSARIHRERARHAIRAA